MKRNVLYSAFIVMTAFILFNTSLTAKAKNINNIETNIDINNPTILKEQATIFYKNGNYLQSLSYFLNVKDSDIDKDSLILMANCYDSLGDMKKAYESLVKAQELDPQNSSIYYNLGILHYKSGNIDFAIDNFYKAAKYKRHFKEAYYNLGNSYFLKKDYKNALKNYLKAYKLDPNNENTVYNLTLIYEKLNDLQKAQIYTAKYKSLIYQQGDNGNLSTGVLNNIKY